MPFQSMTRCAEPGTSTTEGMHPEPGGMNGTADGHAVPARYWKFFCWKLNVACFQWRLTGRAARATHGNASTGSPVAWDGARGHPDTPRAPYARAAFARQCRSSLRPVALHFENIKNETGRET